MLRPSEICSFRLAFDFCHNKDLPALEGHVGPAGADHVLAVKEVVEAAPEGVPADRYAGLAGLGLSGIFCPAYKFLADVWSIVVAFLSRSCYIFAFIKK
jgi:hypothetical protein